MLLPRYFPRHGFRLRRVDESSLNWVVISIALSRPEVPLADTSLGLGRSNVDGDAFVVEYGHELKVAAHSFDPCPHRR